MKFIFLVLSMLLAGNVQAQDSEPKTILFFGDSITAGLGVNKSQAFPALIQKKIDSLGWNYEVINGGLSGETSAGGLRRIDWVLQREIDVMVLELGGNDGLRGIELSSTKQNLQQIIDKVQAKYPEVQIILAGMQVPPNLGQEYTREFQTIYPELAEENDLPLIPMIMDKLGGDEDLMQSDGIHPTPKGHRVIAETIWERLKPMLTE
ncbi:arylesterase [Gracilimonas mengyeensis]|uniref:Acyl-CoA thioesterase-1 n=1 Tax=Gracilimonas mengyeensis TaxID=1302730 RepID=A0A521E1Z2_9BACT|nr:arylesterase [Gracilimonas mengyeensis]SMO77902.1 acyl-CoA thioesterase-1 [Gracilimonas mengyeensis]